jgi:hypothetical protein
MEVVGRVYSVTPFSKLKVGHRSKTHYVHRQHDTLSYRASIGPTCCIFCRRRIPRGPPHAVDSYRRALLHRINFKMRSESGTRIEQGKKGRRRQERWDQFGELSHRSYRNM